MTTTILPGARAETAPSEADTALAKKAGVVLKRVIGKKPGIRLRVALEGAEPDGEAFELPEIAGRLLLHILDETAHGNAVALVPMHAELTTKQAADLLNVSRPFLVKLIEDNAIKFRKVGTHRRVRMDDLMTYKQQSEIRREKALREFAKETQDLGLYD